MKTSNRAETLNLVEIARRFPDDATARAFLEKTRWPNGPVCPHCHGVNNASPITANVAKKIRPGLYNCRAEECGKQFTVTVGTVFEASKVSLSNWLIAWHLPEMRALELKEVLGIGSYRTAWFMRLRIKESGGNLARALSIPADEARAICERTAPAKPRRPPPKPPSRRAR